MNNSDELFSEGRGARSGGVPAESFVSLYTQRHTPPPMDKIPTSSPSLSLPSTLVSPSPILH